MELIAICVFVSLCSGLYSNKKLKSEYLLLKQKVRDGA